MLTLNLSLGHLVFQPRYLRCRVPLCLLWLHIRIVLVEDLKTEKVAIVLALVFLLSMPVSTATSGTWFVFHSQKLSRKTGRQVNGTRLCTFWIVSSENFRGKGSSEKEVLFFQTKCSKRNWNRVPFLQKPCTFDISFRFSRSFLVNGTDLYKW